jgi:DNA-binding LytR/AlgR family response regulator
VSTRPKALIADDEPLLREALVRMLAAAWPELEVVGQARNGREAIELFEQHLPDVCFLDVQMPGKSGVEAAQVIGTRAHLVFVTAFSEYATKAFEHGALDYLVKPVEPTRLAATVQRLRARLRDLHPAADTKALLERLAQVLSPGVPTFLRWLRASTGATVRLISVDRVDFLRSGDKYTAVAYHDELGKACEAVVRTSLKDLVTQLDGTQFAQVHRSTIVNLNSISHVTRGENETAEIYLKGRAEVLPVSRAYLHLFRQM